MKSIFSFLILFIYSTLAQTFDISQNLQLIEKGKSDEVKALLKNFPKNFSDEAYLLLDAILTEEGNTASNKFSDFIKKFPNSKYNQIAYKRLYSFNYTLGKYEKASEYHALLKKYFPDSKYLAEIETINTNEFIKRNESVNEKNSEKSTTDSKLIFTIQVGAFTNIKNAESLRNKIKAKKYSVRIIPKVIGNKKYNVVLVGKYDSIEKAEKVLPKLNQQFSVKGKIISEEK